MTRRTPESPRATRSAKNELQAAPGLAGRDPQAEDFTAAVGVDAGRDEHHGVDHAPAFTDLHRQRVRGNERERARVAQGPVAELLDVLVELGGHPRDL